MAQLSPEGRFIRLSETYNLSDSSAVAEGALTVSGKRLAWTVSDESEVVAVRIADLKGHALPSKGELSPLERWQTRITFLQETGQLNGLCERAYRFDVPRSDVALTFTDAGLHVESRGRRGTVRCDGSEAADVGLLAEPSALGSPGDLITWAVDRVRALPWFGSDRMQWVKAVAFNVLDRLVSVKSRIVPSDGSSQLATEVGDFLSHAVARAPNPQTGWPPPPLATILSPPLQEEGVFRPLDDDPFALGPSNESSPFAFTFLRPDLTRPESQLFVVIWDPRLVELHTMTGTREPKTATGETGSGTVPRDDATIGRLAAAFNGGFQATHGEFGMMAQRVVYLPPKPYAATIAEMADGAVGFGTWPDDEAIADNLIGFRQNLTPLISDAVVNPYSRTWWGGVPPGWQDATRTVRTGLCLTKEHFVAYFYGSSINVDHLASAMVSARCDYGVHLDMNPGHTGFEFYRVKRAGTLPKIQRKLDPTWEARGTVSGTTGWDFLGRRMLKTMHLMHFPRYVRTDSRDFFYLTHRRVLPPDAPASDSIPKTSAEDSWQTQTYDQHGFPPAIATKRFHPDPRRPELEVAVAVLDGKWLAPCTADCSESATVARMSRIAATTGAGVYHFSRKFLVTDKTPPAGAVPIAFGKTEARASRTVAALGVAHRDWLIYAEVTRGGDRSRDAVMLKELLSSLECDDRVYFDQPLGVTIGAASRSSLVRTDLVWVRDESPLASRIMRNTAIVPTATWQPLQAKRVRYVRQRPTAPDIRPDVPTADEGTKGSE